MISWDLKLYREMFEKYYIMFIFASDFGCTYLGNVASISNVINKCVTITQPRTLDFPSAHQGCGLN